MSASARGVMASAAGAVLAALGVGAVVVFGCKPAETAGPDEPIVDTWPTSPPFFEEAKDTGLDFKYVNGEEAGHFAILESLGGGVALIDYDHSGKLSVFVPGGGGYEGPDKKKIVGKPGRLFKNLGGFKFKDVTKEVGLEDFPWFYTHGAAVCDYDRDGWPDLLVTGWGRMALFHNEPIDPKHPDTGGRKFVDVAEKAGLPTGCWTTSAAFADFDGDGYPDLYVCQYVDWSWDNNPECNYGGRDKDGKLIRDVCPPKTFKGLPHKLFANVADPAVPGGRAFKDVSEEAGLQKGGADASKGLGVLALDVNDDGKPDIYVCNDTVDNYLYINECTKGKFKFKEVALLGGAARDERGNANGSMGVDAGDYDGCGRPSIWVTNYENEMHALYHNECLGGKVIFAHHTAKAGIAAIGQKYVAWGTGFVDLDHHGWEDLFIVDGHAIRYPTGKDSSRRQKPVLLRNVGGGKFKVATRQGGPYFDEAHLARGAALGDLDDDGRTDAVISHINDPVAVLHNVADVGENHWLGVSLAGRENADVVGAKVILEAGGRTQTRFAKGGGSYCSSPDRRLVFGLGKTDKIDRITVVWPDRTKDEWKGSAVDLGGAVRQGGREGGNKDESKGLAVDQYHTLTQGGGGSSGN
jgi:hypothetical protein